LFCANRKFKNGDKVRPYALYFSVPWALTIVLLFVNFQITGSLMVIICLIIYFLFEGFYTFLCMPYNSMAALATKNDEERKSINAYRSLGGCIGSGLGAVAIVPLVRLFGGLKDHKIINPTDSKALLFTAIVMGLICVGGSLFHYFTSKERVKPEVDSKEDKIGLLQAYKMLFKCKSWIFNMFYIIGYGITTSLVMQNVNYYAAYVLGDSNKATPILACYLGVAIITSILAPKLDAWIGRKKTMLLAIAIIVIGKLPFILMPSHELFIYINALSVGFGATITFIMFNTNRNNIADVLEQQNHRRIDTLVAGGDNLITKLSEALAIQLMGVVYQLTKFDSEATVQNLATRTAIEGFLGWVPAIITLLMIFFIIRMNIPKELAEAKAKNQLEVKVE
ncbi:MAG: MFS transporter, partial [Bacilli bacterium]|nr:MFS transporter [Bacilli bacterium]